MSLLHRTDIYQGQNEEADRKHSGYGFVLALICVALTLVLASVLFVVAYVRSHHSRQGIASWKRPEGASPGVVVTVGTEGMRVFGRPFVTAGWIVIGVSAVVGLAEIILFILNNLTSMFNSFIRT